MFCLFKTKYVKGRHFVATNYCFVNSSQKRKQANLLVSIEHSYILNTAFDLLQKLNVSSSKGRTKISLVKQVDISNLTK